MEYKISIIIPAYNLEQYICKTLDSVLAQTYPHLEIIVVNDGSKDGTGALIDGYGKGDPRVKVIHQENGGVTSARLRGIAEATGEWIGFVDGDDYVEPDMFARLLENALANHADISHCGYRMVFPDGRVDYYYNSGRMIPQEGIRGCYDLLAGAMVEPGLWNKLYHRKLFAGLDAWMDRSIKTNEDLLMNFYLFRQSQGAIFEDICPYHYVLRRGSAATSRMNQNKLRDPRKVLHRIMDEAEPALMPALMPRLTRLLIYGAVMSLGDQRELIAPYRKEVRRELWGRLWAILCGSECSSKLKIMALWAAVCPASYRWVHNAYRKRSGLDKKYSID